MCRPDVPLPPPGDWTAPSSKEQSYQAQACEGGREVGEGRIRSWGTAPEKAEVVAIFLESESWDQELSPEVLSPTLGIVLW